MNHTRFGILIVFFIIAGIVSCASGTTKSAAKKGNDLIGKWEGVDRTGKLGAFQFFEDGSIILIIDGRPLGGSDPSSLGRLTYTTDFSKDPIKLDILGIDSIGGEHGKILMIVKFLTKDKIKIRTYFSEVRPENFDDETIDDTIILDRKIE
jgi:hypothetical protein